MAQRVIFSHACCLPNDHVRCRPVRCDIDVAGDVTRCNSGQETPMQQSTIIQELEQKHLRENITEFRVGDTVRVSVRVVEGSRERLQDFEGVVIRRRGMGVNENFTVRRIASHGIGVERTFLLHSPRVDQIRLVRTGKVRQANLYYLRGRTGRAARIKERIRRS